MRLIDFRAERKLTVGQTNVLGSIEIPQAHPVNHRSLLVGDAREVVKLLGG